MSDVGAVVLTVGEPSTNRALASLEAQTLPVEDVVVVDGVRPFHRAFNTGVARISTPFFVQVDADMVLDPDCVEVLRAAISSDVGIAVGALRDPLMGRIGGVKLFRRSCLRALPHRNTIGPEVDLYLTLGRRGWWTQYLTGHGRRATGEPTLGAHRPDYTVDYVFGTYYVLGRLYGHRQDARALHWRLTQLRRTAHPMAPVARLAIAHGALGSETGDISKPRPHPDDAAFLRRLVSLPTGAGVAPAHLRRLLSLGAEPLIEAFHELGANLRASSIAGLRACLRVLGEVAHPRSLLAEMALGGGVLTTSQAARSSIPIPLEGFADAWASAGALEQTA